MTATSATGWPEVKVGDMLTLRNGRAFKSSEWKTNGQPIIRIQNLKSADAPFNYYDGDLPDHFAVRDGDLLFAWSGTPGTSFGAHVWHGPDAWLNQHIFRVDFPPEKFDRDFLAYALNRNVDSYIEQAQGGVGLAHITKAKLNASVLPLPPLDEQRRLVAYLDQIDGRRAAITTHLAAARITNGRLRAAVLAAACSGRLTADWRDANPNVSSAEPDFTSNGAVTDLPTGWVWTTVDAIAEVRGGIQKKPDRVPRSNAYPYLRVANVLRGRLDLEEMAEFELFDGELERYALQPGDLLVVEGNGSLREIGRAALWSGEIANCVHQNHLIRVRATDAVPEYLALYWNSPAASRLIAELAVTTAGLYNLSVGKISRVPVAVPPLHEQREIVRRAAAVLDSVDRLSAAISTAETTLDSAMRGALANAFRGERGQTATESAAQLDALASQNGSRALRA